MRPMTSVISCSAVPMKSNAPGTDRLFGSNVHWTPVLMAMPPSEAESLAGCSPSALALAVVTPNRRVPPVGSEAGKLE